MESEINVNTQKRILNFHKSGISIETITLYTEVEEEEVAEIIKNHKKNHNPHQKKKVVGVCFGWIDNPYESEDFLLNGGENYTFFQLSKSEQEIFIERLDQPILNYWQ